MSLLDNDTFETGLWAVLIGTLIVIALVILFVIYKEPLRDTVLVFVVILGIAGPLFIIGGMYLLITEYMKEKDIHQREDLELFGKQHPTLAKTQKGVGFEK